MNNLLSLSERKKLLKEKQKRVEEIQPKIVECRGIVQKADHYKAEKKDKLKEAMIKMETARLEGKPESEITPLKTLVSELQRDIDGSEARTDAARDIWKRYEAERRDLLNDIQPLEFGIQADPALQEIIKDFSPAMNKVLPLYKETAALALKHGLDVQLPPLIDIDVSKYGQIRLVYLYRGVDKDVQN
jgi:chromosome segregation ATPase